MVTPAEGKAAVKLSDRPEACKAGRCSGMGSGAEFDGSITALDAQAILSYVVEEPLPAEFRVGVIG